MDKSVPLRLSTFLDNMAINVFLDGIPIVPVAPIKIALYAMDERYSFIEIYNEWKPAGYKEVSLQQVAENEKYSLYKFKLVLPDKFKKKCPKCKEEFFESEFEEDTKRSVTYLLRIKELPIAMVISNTHFRESDYSFRFFNKYYPFMTRISIRTNQLIEILRKIKASSIYGENIFSTDFILKKRYGEKVTERHYKKRDFESIFLEAKRRGLWLDNITFRTENNSRLQISRDGKIQYYDDFIFSEVLPIIDLIANIYHSSYNLFKLVKERSEEGLKKSIKINLPEPVFVEKKDTNNFIEHLSLYKDSHFTILSQNGPFIETSIIDYKTGSSFDVCIYESKTITIIPQYQATTVSLINLINYLIEEYDGEIEN